MSSGLHVGSQSGVRSPTQMSVWRGNGETGHLHLFRLLLPFPLPSVSEQVHDPLHGGGQEAWRPRGELVGLSRKEEASRTGLDT